MTASMGGTGLQRFRNWFLADFWEGASIVILFLIFPLAQVLSPRSAPVFLLASVVPIFLGMLTRGEGAFRQFSPQYLRDFFSANRSLVAAVAAFLTLMLVQSFRGPQVSLALRDLAYLVAAVLLFLVVSHGQKRPGKLKFVLFLLAGIVLSGLFLLSELNGLTNFHWVPHLLFYHDLNRNAALLAISLPVLLLINWHSNRMRLVLLATASIAVAAIFASSSQSAQMALICAVVAGLVIHFAPVARRVIFAIMALSLLVMPWTLGPLYSLEGKLDSRFLAEAHLSQRLTLWDDYNRLIPRKPIMGWGARADRKLGLDNEMTREIDHQVNHGGAYPHNMAIEIWVNLGLVGAALLAAIVFLCGEAIGRLERRGTIVASQMFAAGFIFSMFHSTVLQTWWIASVTIAAIAFSVLYHHRHTDSAAQ